MLKIKELRQKNKLTIDQLAAKSGVSSRMISAYEAGTSDITLTKLLSIARALGVNFWELVNTSEKNSGNLNKLKSELNNPDLVEFKEMLHYFSEKMLNKLEEKFTFKIKELEGSISDLLHDLEGLEVKVKEVEEKRSKDQSSDSKEA